MLPGDRAILQGTPGVEHERRSASSGHPGGLVARASDATLRQAWPHPRKELLP